MKKVLLILLGVFLSISLMAQNPGCDGIRYLDEVFDSILVTSDIVYGQNTTIGGNEIDLKMDIYEPYDDTLSVRPVVFIVHGGGFTSGSKSGYRFVKLGTDYALKGYVAVSIDYRLYDLSVPLDSFKIKDAIVRGMSDLKAAMRYMNEDANTLNKYKADTNYYFLCGVSSGAIIANTTAYLDVIEEGDDQMRELIYHHGGLNGNSSNNYRYHPYVSSVLNSSGGLLDPGYIDDDDPPLVSAHCIEDPVMPFKRDWLIIGGDSIIIAYGSYFMHAMANLNGIETELIEIPGTVHLQYYLDSLQYNTMLTASAGMFQEISCNDSGGGIPVAIGELQVEANSVIYPNPASTSIRIKGFETYEAEIYNSVGILVKRQGVPDNTINVRGLCNGLYFIVLKNDVAVSKHKLIISR